MDRLRRLMRLSLVPMLFVLPLWITLGRGLFGVGGWEILALLFYYVPTLFVGMFVLAILLTSRSDVKQTGRVSRRDAVLLSCLYGFVFLFGLALVAVGDTDESIKSVLTLVFGSQFRGISDVIAGISFWGIIISGILGLVVGVQEWSQDRRARSKNRVQ